MLHKISIRCQGFIANNPKISVMLAFLFVIAMISMVSSVTGYINTDPFKAVTSAQKVHRNVIQITIGILFLGALSVCGYIHKKQKNAKRVDKLEKSLLWIAEA